MTVINNGGGLELPEAVRVIEPSRNLGYTGGANVSIRDFFRGTSDDLMFLGSHDIIVMTPGAFEAAAAAFARVDAAGVLALSIPGAGAEDLQADADDGDIIYRQLVSGAGLFLRRSCIEQVGLFDERFGSYVEDVDYCYRARAAGWRVGHVTTAHATMRGSGDASAARRNIAANEIVLWLKHGQQRRAVRMTARYVKRLILSAGRRDWATAQETATILGYVGRRSGRLALSKPPFL